MSRHWNPKDELVRVRATRAETRWPQGATAGLILVAAGCIGLVTLLYKVAGPHNVFKP